ncbi:hypothetical protein GGQ84_002735 [Desulfitispora alkaliphila]|uniref:hypothetical protein n=1 Tax=Desulfitispora alkaliphila TaxID=622674 RepID=UPI003D21A4E5
MEESSVKKNNQGIDTAEKIYPSAELMLAVIQKEYEHESDRVRSLEARTGIFLAFAGALLVFLSSSLKLPEFRSIEVNSIPEAFPIVLVIIFTFLTLATLILAVIFFVRVISIQTYKRLAIKGFVESNTKEKVDKIAMEIMADYQKVVKHNNEVNNQKVEIYRKGIYLIMAAVIMTAIVYSINMFI